MEEKQEPQKYITVTEATILFADATIFQASPMLLKRLSARASKEQRISLPKEMPDGLVCLHWIEE